MQQSELIIKNELSSIKNILNEIYDTLEVNKTQFNQYGNGTQIQNQCNITLNPNIRSYPCIGIEGIHIKVISDFINIFFTKYPLIVFTLAYLVLVPFTVYDHLNLQQSIFTITSAQHKIGMSFFYFFGVSLYYVFIKIAFLPLTTFFIKAHTLKNDSYNGILFKDIRKIIISNHYFDSTLLIYKRNRVKPITYLLSDKDDALIIQDVFSGYLETEQFKADL